MERKIEEVVSEGVHHEVIRKKAEELIHKAETSGQIAEVERKLTALILETDDFYEVLPAEKLKLPETVTKLLVNAVIDAIESMPFMFAIGVDHPGGVIGAGNVRLKAAHVNVRIKADYSVAITVDKVEETEIVTGLLSFKERREPALTT